MAVTTFESSRREVTVKDLIARAAFVAIHAVYRVMDEIKIEHQRRQTERELSRLPDTLLQDIGLERADIRTATRRY